MTGAFSSMNIDHTHLVKYLGHEDTINFSNLEHISSNKNGNEIYNLTALNKIKVSYNNQSKKVSVEANLPYYWQGHNFSVSSNNIKDAIQSISEALSSDITSYDVQSFEFGSTLLVNHPVNEYINNHHELRGKIRQLWMGKRANRETGIEYNGYGSGNLNKLKIYDAGHRIKENVPKVIRTDLIEKFAYDSTHNYLRIENHIFKPCNYYHLASLTLNDLLKTDFLASCKKDLINIYKQIEKTGLSLLPKDKKDITSATLPLLYFQDRFPELMTYEVRKEMLRFIKSYDGDVLSKYDKKHRCQQLNDNWDKIQSNDESRYDLTKQLLNTPIIY
jgi:hypothetical protein